MHVLSFHNVVESFKAVVAGEAESKQAAIVFFTILLIAGVIWIIILICAPTHATYYIDS
jgi:hypothetical protein